MASPLPFKTGPAHLVGIGGIGMSGIAEIMLTMGYEVQGSDMRDGPNIERLRRKGATVHIGHEAANVTGAGAVILSTAIPYTNPEVVAARAQGIPVVRRSNMLAELVRLKWTVCVAGTHGKTTTTTMVSALLDGGGLDPTVINGGIVNAYGSNAKAGKGDWMVVEADESDGTFTRLSPTLAVVTNVDPEHLDHHGSMDNLRAAFDQFVDNMPYYGLAVLCADHPEVQRLAERLTDRRKITYGLKAGADVQAVNIRLEPTGSRFDVMRIGEAYLTDVFLPMAGEHNIQNALAAICVARNLGVSAANIAASLEAFSGVARRLTLVGDVPMTGGNLRIYDDYAHHPVEIAAVLKAGRAMAGDSPLIIVVQPHRYSRLSDLFQDFATCFADADHVLITPVYAAGETPMEGIDHATLAQAIRATGHKSVTALETITHAPALIATLGKAGGVCLCAGAGDITNFAAGLAAELG